MRYFQISIKKNLLLFDLNSIEWSQNRKRFFNNKVCIIFLSNVLFMWYFNVFNVFFFYWISIVENENLFDWSNTCYKRKVKTYSYFRTITLFQNSICYTKKTGLRWKVKFMYKHITEVTKTGHGTTTMIFSFQ